MIKQQSHTPVDVPIEPRNREYDIASSLANPMIGTNCRTGTPQKKWNTSRWPLTFIAQWAARKKIRKRALCLPLLKQWQAQQKKGLAA